MKGAIFNVNNLIVDTNQQQFDAWRELAMYEYGLGLPGKLAPQLKNLSAAAALPIVLNQLHQTADEAEQAALLAEQEQMYQKALDSLDESSVMPGIERLLINLDDHYVNMGVVDNGGHAELILKQLQIADYFTAIIPNEGDPYSAFAQQLSAVPNECIALATTPADIDAINQAHLISIGIGDAELLSAADYQVAQTGDLWYPMLRKVWEDHHENK